MLAGVHFNIVQTVLMDTVKLEAGEAERAVAAGSFSPLHNL
jgi:hypothetical protein